MAAGDPDLTAVPEILKNTPPEDPNTTVEEGRRMLEGDKNTSK